MHPAPGHADGYVLFDGQTPLPPDCARLHLDPGGVPVFCGPCAGAPVPRTLDDVEEVANLLATTDLMVAVSPSTWPRECVMTQVRVMGDDAEEVGAVLEMLLPLLRACTGLVVGSPTELSKRGPGRRIVFELLPAGPGTVRIERPDDDPAPPRRTRRARELPRGRT